MPKYYALCDNNYNLQKESITKKIDIKKDYDYTFNDNIVELYLDDKLKLKAEYAMIGVYNIPMSVWYWGWNVAFVNKKLVEGVKAVRDFEKVLDKDYAKFDKMEAEELHYLVSNDNFYISGKNVDKIIKLVLYLTKGVWIFPIKKESDKVEYILITKILQFS